METITLGNIEIHLHLPQHWQGTVAYVLEPEKVMPALAEVAERGNFAVATIFGMDWNHDLTPWAAPAIFKGEKDFGGGADAFLERLEREILPAIESRLPAPPKVRLLGGISLGGLFSLYAAHRSKMFQGIASVSGSLWYTKFIDFIERNNLSPAVRGFCLLMGEEEPKAKHKVLSKTGMGHEMAVRRFGEQADFCRFALTKGGHFDDGPRRISDAILWLAERIKS